MKKFQSKKAVWWGVGIFVMIGGLFVAALILPQASEPYGSDGVPVDEPAMQNAPESEHAPRLQLE